MRNSILIMIFCCLFGVDYSFSQNQNTSHEIINDLLLRMDDYTSKSQYEKAYQIGTKVLSFLEVEKSDPDSLLGEIYTKVGNACIDNGNYSEAKTCFDKCLENQIKITEEGSIEIAKANFNLGLYYDYSNEFELALEHYNKTKNICLKFIPESSDLISMTYYNMAVCFAFLEDYQKAIQMSNKALEIDYDLYGLEHIEIAYDLNNLGILYSYIENYNKALTNFIESKRILKKNAVEDDVEIARLNLNIGDLYNIINEYEKALKYLFESLRGYKKHLSKSDHRIIRNYWVLATVFYNKNEHENALKYLYLAKEMSLLNKNIEWETFEVIYYFLAKTHLAKSNLSQSKIYLEKAKNTIFPDPSIIPKCTNGKKLKTWASLLVFEGDWLLVKFKQEKEIELLLKAQQNYREALALGKARRATFQGEQSKESWLTRRYSIFEKAIACDYLLAQKTGEESYLHQAYELAEQSKALLLLDALQKSKAEHFAGIPDSLLQKEKALSADIADLEQNIFETSEGEELDSQTIVLQGQLFEMQANYDSLIVFLGEKYPRYEQLQHQRKILSIPDLQKGLKEEEAILQYFLGDSSLFAFFINKQKIQIQKTALDFPLDQWVTDWRLVVEGYGNGPTNANAAEKYVELSNELYKKLLAPFADQLPKELTIIADGVLGYLPFEALLVTPPKEIGRYRSYDYFLHHHQLSYSFSTTWGQEIATSQSTGVKSGVLAVAPVFGNSPIAAADRFSGLDALRFNQKEAAAIVDSWGGKILAGMEATEAAFCKAAPNYQILHLATHAKANDESGAYSFLAFTEIPDSIENEILYTRELYELSLQAELVVLSACETGVGELQRGEGVISLARGFSYAGARSIVTTLWRVSDNKAAQLMTYFYDGLKQKLPKDRALQKSKIDYLASCRDRDAHPFYWAAFIPLGNMEALSSPVTGAWWKLGLGFLLLALGGLFVKWNRPQWFKR